VSQPKPPTQKNFGLWESGNPKAGFPLSHSPDSLRRKEENSFRKGLPPSRKDQLLPLSAAFGFSIILRWNQNRFQYHSWIGKCCGLQSAKRT
jgi:hypothetical protein